MRRAEDPFKKALHRGAGVRDPPPHDEAFAAVNAAKATSSEDSLDLDWHFSQESLKRRYLFIEILRSTAYHVVTFASDRRANCDEE